MKASPRRAPPPPPPGSSVSRRWRVAIPVVLAASVLLVLATKPNRDAPASAVAVPEPVASHAASGTVPHATGIPRLVDLGADQCIPCKAMAPILVELRREYAGRMQVDFIDVWKNPGAEQPHNIYAIPTQIFFDPSGKELTRHEGFISKADILATWKRVGYEFGGSSAAAPGR